MGAKMSEQFEKKGRMFFGQVGGSKEVPKDRELQQSGYFTSAPASLPGAPQCAHGHTEPKAGCVSCVLLHKLT